VIDVRTVWVESERPVRKHQDGGLHLTVLLLSPDMARKRIAAEGLADDVLGLAIPDAGRAYIFCDRVVSMPGTQVFRIQLGAVIAHEVGHLVLGEQSHSRSGIMRAQIAGRHAIHLASFDKVQARMIRATLSEPATAAGRR
jgi:hypothetical protein